MFEKNRHLGSVHISVISLYVCVFKLLKIKDIFEELAIQGNNGEKIVI